MLDIDVQGVVSIKKTDLNPNYLFVKPPSIEELEKRLKVMTFFKPISVEELEKS